MKYFLLLAFACAFSGASCETPSGLTRSCPGSTVQTAYYRVAGSCGANGVVTVTVAAANDCSIALLEPTAVGLPTLGSFSDLGSTTNFELAKGNWDLVDPSQSNQVGTTLNCTSGDAEASGELNFVCELRVCAVTDESDDVECMTGGTCMSHFTPTSADAGIVVPAQDAAIDASP